MVFSLLAALTAKGNHHCANAMLKPLSAAL
jgi:hypothetical protein